MFVVRLKRPNEDFDFKAFKSKKRALARFTTAQQEIIDGDVEQCALFEVDAPDSERAVALASEGKGRLIESNLEDPPPKSPARSARSRPDPSGRDLSGPGLSEPGPSKRGPSERGKAT
jgi:hypothetical protein